jgi:hypothetical protein
MAADAMPTTRFALAKLCGSSVGGHCDDTLEDRVNEARPEWLERAQEAIDEQVGPEVLATLRTEAADRLSELETVITEINERLRLAANRFTLPPIEVPQPEIDEDALTLLARYRIVKIARRGRIHA